MNSKMDPMGRAFTGCSNIQTIKAAIENKFSLLPFSLYVIPLGFKPKTFRTGI